MDESLKKNLAHDEVRVAQLVEANRLLTEKLEKMEIDMGRLRQALQKAEQRDLPAA